MGLLCGGSGYISLIFLLSYLVQSAWTRCTECTNENKEEILTLCQLSAANLLEAEQLQNDSLVCSRFHELFECVGGKVPQCLDEFSEQYDHYTYSPWNCPTSHEQLMTYQKLVQNGCTSKTDTQNSRSVSKTETQTSSSVSNSDLKTRPNTHLFLAVLCGILLLKKIPEDDLYIPIF